MRGKLQIVIAACALLAGLSAASAGEEPVFFADAHLKRLVENRLWIWDPTPTDMLGLTELTISHQAIVDLSGLEHAINLQRLSIRVSQISDLSPLSGLTNLETLFLSDNEICDLSPLSGLTSLRELDMHHNRISDLSPLSGLTNLRFLQFFNNQIRDLSPLLGLTNLTFLELRENPLNEQAYCSHLQMIDDNNPRVFLMYSPNRRPPAGITASKGTLPDRVRITWDAVCNGPLYSRYTYYQVSRARSADDAPNPISEWQTSLSFDDVTAEPGTKYSYRVRTASSSQGDRAGDYSEPDMGWVPGPSSLTVSSGPGGVVTIPGEGLYPAEVGQTMPIHAQPVDANLYFFAGWTGTAVETGLVADANRASATITVDNARSTLKANFLSRMNTVYVDDDAPSDPGPRTAMVSDPQEDGTPEHAFDMIQEGIDVVLEGATVVVRSGTYRECIEFRGRNITVTSLDRSEPPVRKPLAVLDASYAGTPVTFKRGEDANCVLSGFVITRGKGDVAGAVRCAGSSPTIANCLIVGNQADDPYGGVVYCTGSDAVFVNCTIADNLAGAQGTGVYMSNSNVGFVNCIIWANTPSDSFPGGRYDGGSRPWMTYTDMVKAPFAPGNIVADPLFAQRGWWDDPNDPNVAVSPDAPDAAWVEGDYHLKSQAGRWDPLAENWVLDSVTSPCIDAGDPNSPVGHEPPPNGAIINMGAFGGTAEASKSYVQKL